MMIIFYSMLNLAILITILCLLREGSAEYILDDQQHGNAGVGVHNLIDGIDNEWNGDGNQIRGEKNAVKGSENKVQGNYNRIEGQGNVVGDISPEELARLQNEMAEKLQARFQNIFGGNPMPRPEINAKSNPVPAQPAEGKEESTTLQPQPQKIQEVRIVPVQPTTEYQQQSVIQVSQKATKEKRPLVRVAAKVREQIRQVTLLFRSFGNRKESSDVEDLYNPPSSQTALSLLCRRFRLCDRPRRRICFSSQYPPFPSQPLS